MKTWKCWTSCLLTQDPSSSPLQALHSRRYQSHLRAMASSARNKWLVPQCISDLVFCFAGSVDRCQKLGYRTAALSPSQALPSHLSKLRYLLLRLQSSSAPSILKTSSPRENLKRRTKDTAVTKWVYQPFRQVAEVVHIEQLEHVTACVSQLALSTHIVRKVAQQKVY